MQIFSQRDEGHNLSVYVFTNKYHIDCHILEPASMTIPVTRVSDMMVGAVNQKQTPSSLPSHIMFLTEVTSMSMITI